MTPAQIEAFRRGGKALPRHDARSTPRELRAMDRETAAYVLAVIASRAGDVLDADTLAEIETALCDKPAPIMLPGAIAERIEAVLDAIEARLDAMEATRDALAEAATKRAVEDAFVDSASVETQWQRRRRATILLRSARGGRKPAPMSEGEPSNSGRDTGGRFTPGNKASRGKPPGARHRASILAERIFADNIKSICEVVTREAKAGANWACKLVVERILPPAKDRPTPFPLSAINSPADLPPFATRLLEAVAAGELTPAEGDALLGMVDKLRAALNQPTWRKRSPS